MNIDSYQHFWRHHPQRDTRTTDRMFIRQRDFLPKMFCRLVTEADWRDRRTEHFAPYLDVVFVAFGPERLMFVSDGLVCLVAGTYRHVMELMDGCSGRLTAEQREGIFGGTRLRATA